MHFSRTKYILAYFCIAILVSGTIYAFSYRTNLYQLSQTGAVRVEQARDRLLGQLASFRQLPNFLAKHPDIKTLLIKGASSTVVNEFLLNTALISGASSISILDKYGKPIASSNFTATHNLADIDKLLMPHVRAAMNGRLGFHHSIDPHDKNRKFYFARKITDQDPSQIGVIVVQVDVASLEFEWRVDEEVLSFVDTDNIIFITNRQSLALLNTIDQHSPDLDVNTTNQHFLKHTKQQVFSHGIWAFENANVLPSQALVVSKFIPQIKMTAHVFLNTQSAKAAARLQSLLSVSLFALIGFGILSLYQRRKRLAELLAIEEASNIKLEARIETRTEQLHKVQHQLIQAGKLTALGQMSAGISHELNQPLAAIQNFAESGEKLIDRGRENDARENFAMITNQIDRISRIIRSLRAFARNEKETIEPVDIQNVITESINLSETRCKNEGVIISRTGSKDPVYVMGGHVRLQQVVINLITNAIDAMSKQIDKRIEIQLQETPDEIHLKFLDTGSGFDDPSRVFEPFYSTKKIGTSKGMGLGLSISYGIIGSFGGNIICRNHPCGGAEFTIILIPAVESDAT